MNQDYGDKEFARIRKLGRDRFNWDIIATQLRNEISRILDVVNDATYKEIWPKVKHIAKQYNIAERKFKTKVSRTLDNMKKCNDIVSTTCKRVIEVQGYRKVKK